MRSDTFICFVYHELGVPGRATCRSNPGYMRYVVKASCFAQQLVALREGAGNGCNVTEAVGGMEHAVAITFDDCASTDVEVAGPLLREAGLRATFYAVSSWINTAGHLTGQDLRRLVSMGLELGSHSLSHSFLPGMSTSEIRRELAESRDYLEQLSGASVQHFSCPFGGVGPRLREIAMEVGYTTMATSRIGHNMPGATILNRVPIYRDTSLDAFKRMCNGGGLTFPRIRQTLLAPLKCMTRFQGYSQ